MKKSNKNNATYPCGTCSSMSIQYPSNFTGNRGMLFLNCEPGFNNLTCGNMQILCSDVIETNSESLCDYQTINAYEIGMGNINDSLLYWQCEDIFSDAGKCSSYHYDHFYLFIFFVLFFCVCFVVQ